VKVLDDTGWGTSASIANGIRFTVGQRTNAAVAEQHRPFVINMSLISSAASADIEDALRQAVNSGMVVVAAAGNDGKANPDYPARHAKESWANGQIIAVGAVDSDNRMAPLSNRAGDAARFYLVAPGVDVYSTYPEYDRNTKKYAASYAFMSGTSMAAPYVTAGITLIKSAWPYLEAPQIADILLVSADDLGEPGIDKVYGRGLLNLTTALSPIGVLATPTSSGASMPLGTSNVSTSAVTAAALRGAAGDGQFKMAAFDRYGRDFEVDLAPAVRRARPAASGLASMFAALDAQAATHIDRAGNRLRVNRQSQATRLSLGAPDAGGESFAFSAFDASGYEVTAGSLGMGNESFGLAGELTRDGMSSLNSTLANPFFSLAPQHGHAAIGLPLGGGLRLKIGNLFTDSSAGASGLEPQLSGRRQSITLAEVSATKKTSLWSLSFGRLSESDSMLGSTHSGGLAWDGDIATAVLTFGAAFEVRPHLRIGAQYSAGLTGAVRNGADSLITGYGDVRSESYAVFALLEQPFGTQDSLTFALSQPLRPVSGAMEMTVPVAAAEDGSPVMEQRAISLQPAGRELRADVLYTSPVNRTTTWFLGGAVRHQPEHDASAPTETFVGTGLRKNF
jgi:hypothetical protein